MSIEVLISLTVLVAITMWLAFKHAITAHQASLQRDIALRGAMCQGRVVAIQRPFLLDNCTRLYFDFQPDGETDAVRGCHVDRRSPAELQASLPAQGTLVTIRYLPHQPRRAVIGKLIS
ncbi:MAG TPA: hypothetical protein VNA21_02840 [Steroidobacteraceae bacterium]|nr:hypothetical protein [Steroidobacteraceae bacterium]